MILLGRTVIETPLDPVPELMRATDRLLVMNAREIAATRQGCALTFAVIRRQIKLCEGRELARRLKLDEVETADG